MEYISERRRDWHQLLSVHGRMRRLRPTLCSPTCYTLGTRYCYYMQGKHALHIAPYAPNMRRPCVLPRVPA